MRLTTKRLEHHRYVHRFAAWKTLNGTHAIDSPKQKRRHGKPLVDGRIGANAKKHSAVPSLLPGAGRRANLFKPWTRGMEMRVHILNISHTVLLQPVGERRIAVLHENRDAALPDCASAEDTRKVRPGFGG